jgi:uncharacterized protein YbjT (DUF2867 family)
MILVTGATGKTGREVVRGLLAAGEPVRAFVRDVDRARATLGPGIDLRRGDLDDPASVAAALADVEKVFLASPPDPRQVEQQGRAVELAQAAGVRHIVKLSALGAAQDSPVSFGRWHRRTELQIQESGIAYTHLRPHFFMQNTLAYGASIAADGCIYAPMKNGRISLVDCSDAAGVAVAALTQPGHEGKIYDITGPEALSFTEIAGTIGEVIGREVRYVEVPPVEAEKQMIAAGYPNWLADAMNALFRLFADGHGSTVTSSVADATGRPARNYATFVRQHADWFRGIA